MLLNEWLRLIAGTFVLISVILGLLHSSYWFIRVYQMVPDDYVFEKAGGKGISMART